MKLPYSTSEEQIKAVAQETTRFYCDYRVVEFRPEKLWDYLQMIRSGKHLMFAADGQSLPEGETESQHNAVRFKFDAKDIPVEMQADMLKYVINGWCEAIKRHAPYQGEGYILELHTGEMAPELTIYANKEEYLSDPELDYLGVPFLEHVLRVGREAEQFYRDWRKDFIEDDVEAAELSRIIGNSSGDVERLAEYFFLPPQIFRRYLSYLTQWYQRINLYRARVGREKIKRPVVIWTRNIAASS